MAGVLLLLMHPEVANRDCEDCNLYIYEESGKRRENKEKGGPVRRAAGAALPCQSRTGCPKGSPESNTGLTDKNYRAYIHYLECKATGDWPDDCLVKQNAGIIRMAEGIAERNQQWEINQNIKMQCDLLLNFMTATAVRP